MFRLKEELYKQYIEVVASTLHYFELGAALDRPMMARPRYKDWQNRITRYGISATEMKEAFDPIEAKKLTTHFVVFSKRNREAIKSQWHRYYASKDVVKKYLATQLTHRIVRLEQELQETRERLDQL